MENTENTMVYTPHKYFWDARVKIILINDNGKTKNKTYTFVVDAENIKTAEDKIKAIADEFCPENMIAFNIVYIRRSNIAAFG